MKSDRPLLEFIIDGGGNDGDELPNSGVREAFFGGGYRWYNRCFSVSAVVGGEDK